MKEIIYLVVIQSEAKNLDNIIVDVTEILRFVLNDKNGKEILTSDKPSSSKSCS